MASDIFDVQPPAWLTNLARPADTGVMAKVLGELTAGAGIAAGQADKDVAEAKSKGEDLSWGRAWLQDIPKGIGEARLNLLDPLWKLKVSEQGLHVQALQQNIKAKQQQMDATAQDQQVIPAWLAQHPTWESRQSADWPSAVTPQGSRMLNDLRLRDSQSVQQKVAVEGIKDFSTRISALAKDDPTAAAQISAQSVQYTSRGQMPPPEMTEALTIAEQSAAQRKENQRVMAEQEAIARGETPETRITEKGVQKIFKPKTSTAAFMPEEVTLPSGTKMIRVGPRQFRFAPKSGQEIELTASQLLAVAEGLKLRSGATPQQKADANRILDYLEKKALGQMDKTAPKVEAPKTETPKENPYKVGGLYRSGDKKLRYKGGDWNQESSWEIVP